MTLPHLDDDQLNAHLDGEDGGAAAIHLAQCGECDARLTVLRAAQTAVAAPIPAPLAEDREAAIAAALDAWPADADPLADRGEDASAPIPLRQPRQALPRVLVAAAVLVVIGLAAVPFLRLGDDGPTVSTAARDAATDTAAGGTAPVDLGEFDSDTALHDRLRTVLGVSGPAPASGASEAFATSDAAPLSGSSELTSGARTSERAASGAPKTRSIGACQAAAVALAGKDHTTLAFSASLVYRGTPGYVFVFVQQDGERLTRRAVVVDRSSCSPLVVQSF